MWPAVRTQQGSVLSHNCCAPYALLSDLSKTVPCKHTLWTYSSQSLLGMQGPPGTGKTSAIIAIISALLAKHYTSPPQPLAPRLDPRIDSLGPMLTPLDDPGSSGALTAATSKAHMGVPNLSRNAVKGTSALVEPNREDGRKGRGPGAERDATKVPLPCFRILVCAQSNAAIDEVIARLASPGLFTGAAFAL